MDPPDHTRMRRLVGRAFAPRRVQQLRAPIRKPAEQLLDALGERSYTDPTVSYAALLDLTGTYEH
ncbi:hypothetical protein [Streptomyces sp. SAI-129]|uniref:hypothetical protein n=1 Tax=Streptomyces sp. SAI-129 TaxID=3377727 RepID=UPI003C7E04DE